MKRYFWLSLIVAVLSSIIQPLAAQKAITVEDIWQRYTFYPSYVTGFNFQKDGQSYTRQEQGKIVSYDFLTNKKVADIFDVTTVEDQVSLSNGFNSYSFSKDEQKLLIKTETESIYRRSTRANFLVYDRTEGTFDPVFEEGKQMYATFNPQADKVAFVFDNNLYYKDLATEEIVQITDDGQYNHIINGGADWVYEEEFAIAKAFEWSPDGKKIAFLRFDESRVKEFTMEMYNDDLYPEYVTFKYPKVGEDNAIVTVHIYDLEREQIAQVETGTETDIYLPRIKWTQDPNQLCVYRMNRHQNELELLLADAKTGKTKLLYKEVEDQYIEEALLDNLVFLEDGKHFLWMSEMDSWRHLYLFDMKGELVRQLTEGDWEVTSFYGMDEENETIFYQAAEDYPLQRHVYSINLKGKQKKQLSEQDGWNSADFNSTFDYFELSHSTINTATTYAVYDRNGKLVRTLEDNARMADIQEEHGVSPVEFFDFTTKDDVQLNGYMIKPADFDESKEYPVFMFLYGGPGSQQVTDSWKGQNYWWFQMLAQQGYIVACVDNRGTGGRGEEFKKVTYLQLGYYETIDQIEAAKYLGSLSYTDKNRIGIFGWSYGGYMSSLCLLKGNDVFKAAIAVAPVTSWKWYDTIYTERYMRTLRENRDGYEDNSPIYFADRLQGNYLLVHGMGDDNVHFQHTVEMSNALINANKQFDTYFYPNRNHGIYGGVTRLHLYNKMTSFLQKNLMNDDSPVGEARP